MKSIGLNPWPDDSILNHISTSWEIASDWYFSNLLETVPESVAYRDMLITNIIVPVDKIYYVRCRRHFDNGTTGDIVGPMPLKADTGTDTIESKPEYPVETPYIYLDTINTNSTQISIKLSEFRSKITTHKSTSWMLKNQDGDVVYRSMMDEENKNNIIVKDKDMSVDVDTVQRIEVSVVHHGVNGASSIVRKEEFFIKVLDVEITSNLNGIYPDIDYLLSIDRDFERVIIRDINKDILSIHDFTGSREILISKDYLSHDIRLYVDVYVDNNSLEDEENYRRFSLSTSADKDYFYINKHFKYTETTMKRGFTKDIEINSGSFEELLGGKYLVYDISRGILAYQKYNRLTGNMYTAVDAIVDGEMNIKGNVGMSVNKLSDNRLLIHHVHRISNLPVFSIYKYEYNEPTLTFMYNLVSPDESVDSMNNLSQVIMIAKDVFMHAYLSATTNKIKFRMVDLITKTTDELESPMENIDTASMFMLENGTPMAICENKTALRTVIYSYNITDGIWVPYKELDNAIGPHDLIAYTRRDGKIYLIPNVNSSDHYIVLDPYAGEIYTINYSENFILPLNSVYRTIGGRILRANSYSMSRMYEYK